MYQQYLYQAQTTIARLSTDELKELINDDEKLEELVTDVLKDFDKEKDVIINENRNLAEANVNKEPEIIERKGRISELSEEGKALCVSVQEKLADLKTKTGDNTPDTALALLQAAAAEAEESSEATNTKFLEKEIPIDEFLEQFTTARKLMHLRKLKTEKMIELMRQQRSRPASSNVGGGSGVPYPPSNFYGPNPGMVPYPTGPLAMPMPNAMFRHF